MCRRSCIAVIGVDPERNKAIIRDTQCGCYACEQCRDGIQRNHQARIIHGTKEHPDWKGRHWSFVTLTSHESVRTFHQSLALFQRVLPQWHKRMRRRYGRYSYVLVFETHLNGAVHAHLLMNVAVSKKQVRRHARQLGLGYMADVQRLHSPAAAGKYVSKYISKSLSEDKNFPKRFKRVRYSHDWPEWPLRQQSSIREWTPVSKQFAELQLHIQAAVEDGLSVSVDHYLTEQYPELSGFLAKIEANRVRGGMSHETSLLRARTRI